MSSSSATPPGPNLALALLQSPQNVLRSLPAKFAGPRAGPGWLNRRAAGQVEQLDATVSAVMLARSSTCSSSRMLPGQA
jgi:hypothetical protein